MGTPRSGAPWWTRTAQDWSGGSCCRLCRQPMKIHRRQRAPRSGARSCGELARSWPAPAADCHEAVFARIAGQAARGRALQRVRVVLRDGSLRRGQDRLPRRVGAVPRHFDRNGPGRHEANSVRGRHAGTASRHSPVDSSRARNWQRLRQRRLTDGQTKTNPVEPPQGVAKAGRPASSSSPGRANGATRSVSGNRGSPRPPTPWRGFAMFTRRANSRRFARKSGANSAERIWRAGAHWASRATPTCCWNWRTREISRNLFVTVHRNRCTLHT